MWNASSESVIALRERIISAPIGTEMIVSAEDLVNAVDQSCDNWGMDGVETVMQDKLDDSGSDFIASLLLYGNIAPVCIFIQPEDFEDFGYRKGDVTIGNGNHRLAVLAHWGMPVKIVKARTTHTESSTLPYAAGGVMADSSGHTMMEWMV